MHVDALTFKAVIERQRLVDLAGHVQPHAPVDAAVVGVEVARIPLVSDRIAGGAVRVLGVGHAEGPLLVARRVVHLHREHILLSVKPQCIGDVDSVRGHAILVQANLLAVEEYVARLSHALELEEDLVAGEARGQLEVLAIPREAFVGASVPAAMRDQLAEGVHVVETVRRGDRGPLGIVEGRSFGARHILTHELPVVVEVQGGARGLRRGIGCRCRLTGGQCRVATPQDNRKS